MQVVVQTQRCEVLSGHSLIPSPNSAKMAAATVALSNWRLEVGLGMSLKGECQKQAKGIDMFPYKTLLSQYGKCHN